MAKKIFIISAIVFVLTAVLLGVFYFMPKNKKTEITNQEDEKEEKNLSINNEEENKESRFIKIIENGVAGAAIDDEGDSIIYCRNKNFSQAGLDGQFKMSLLAYPFEEVEKITWSARKDKALIKTKSGYFLGHLKENKTEKLKDKMENIVFNGFGDKLIYKYSGSEPKNIDIAPLDAASWEVLVPVNHSYLALLAQPDSNNFLYFPSPYALQATELFFFDYKQKQNRKIFEKKFGADYLWSPKGDKILVSFILDNDKSRMSLAVMNSEGGQFQGLNFPTSVKKCAWSKDNKTVYCAMMNDFPSQALLPQEWENGKYENADTFWKIDTQKGKTERILNLEDISEKTDGVNFFLDKEENYLFFINKKNQALYRISL